MKNAIECIGLRKTFDNNEKVLNGIDLKIEKGSITIILGLSGSGKSVLLKHLLGLIPPTDGVIKILGNDLRTLSFEQLRELRGKFGVLFQNSALFNDMTVIENVMFPLKEKNRSIKLPNYDLYNKASTMLESLGIASTQFEKLPSQISGGMQKRVGLARALVLKPEILFYDEPVTGLDPITTSMVNKLIINTHKKSSGLTSVIVSHDLLSSLHMADKIAMIHDGKVLLFGTPSDFKNSKDPHVIRFSVFKRQKFKAQPL